MKTYQLFASGYTASQPGEGVVLLELSGPELKKVCGWKGLINPSYVLPVGDCLYGVEERPGQASVVRLSLDPPHGEVQRFSVPGSGLCHLSSQGGNLYAAGYAGGTLTGLKAETGELCAFLQHQGHSANPARQEKAHVHSSLPSPDGKELLAADLGLDRLFRYRVGENGALALNPAEPWAEVPPGQGPRHFAFHPSGQWMYLVNELEKTLYGFRYQGAEKKIQFIGEYDISKPATEGSLAADVHFTPEGSWLQRRAGPQEFSHQPGRPVSGCGQSGVRKYCSVSFGPAHRGAGGESGGVFLSRCVLREVPGNTGLGGIAYGTKKGGCHWGQPGHWPGRRKNSGKGGL